jgi:hypothetical protein
MEVAMTFDPLFLIPIAITLAGVACGPRRREPGERTLTTTVILLITLRGTTPAQRVKILTCLPRLLAAAGARGDGVRRGRRAARRR